MSKFINQVNKWMGYASQLILLGMVFLTTIDVIGRFFFNNPITGTFELTELGLALVIFLGLGLTHMHNEHIAIDIVTDKFSRIGQAITDIIIDSFIAIFMTIVAWQMWEKAQRISDANTTTGDLKLPISIFIIFAAFGMLTFALSALVKILNVLKKVVGKNVS